MNKSTYHLLSEALDYTDGLYETSVVEQYLNQLREDPTRHLRTTARSFAENILQRKALSSVLIMDVNE